MSRRHEHRRRLLLALVLVMVLDNVLNQSRVAEATLSDDDDDHTPAIGVRWEIASHTSWRSGTVGVMRARDITIAAAIVACAHAPNFAGLKPGPRKVHLEERIVSGVLPNGMRVAFVPDQRTNVGTITVRYDVGSADDPPNAAGLAHYVEHVLWETPFR